jgi:hypothetical protein
VGRQGQTEKERRLVDNGEDSPPLSLRLIEGASEIATQEKFNNYNNTTVITVSKSISTLRFIKERTLKIT